MISYYELTSGIKNLDRIKIRSMLQLQPVSTKSDLHKMAILIVLIKLDLCDWVE